MNITCLKCKGRNFCSRPVCPVLQKISAQKKVNLGLKEHFFGKSPNIFIGKYGYPDVNVGFLGVKEYEDHDEPLLWSRDNYNIRQIIELRSALVNSTFKANIKGQARFLENAREVSMAIKPVDMELKYNKKPVFSLSLNQDIIPHGPSVRVEKAKIIDNPKIPLKVDRLVSDSGLKASQAMQDLYGSHFDEHYLTKLLSLGNLGYKTQRKLVPTRWAITATDDTIGKKLLIKVRDYKEEDYSAYFGGYLGNYYLVLLFPSIFSYELFESHVQAESFATDYEGFEGRKNYASDTAGGYYAARLAILEHLNRLKRQAKVLCLRFITDEYWAPLGVWVVREAARMSMASTPMKFDDMDSMLDYSTRFVKDRFDFNLKSITAKSKVLKDLTFQKRLTSQYGF